MTTHFFCLALIIISFSSLRVRFASSFILSVKFRRQKSGLTCFIVTTSSHECNYFFVVGLIRGIWHAFMYPSTSYMDLPLWQIIRYQKIFHFWSIVHSWKPFSNPLHQYRQWWCGMPRICTFNWTRRSKRLHQSEISRVLDDGVHEFGHSHNYRMKHLWMMYYAYMQEHEARAPKPTSNVYVSLFNRCSAFGLHTCT